MANSDLQQINGPALFPATADVGTNADPFLVPTDGKFITAASNAGNQAPVKPAFLSTKGLLLGLRDALIGDRMGAVQKTSRSLRADATGGNTHAVGAGIISALNDLFAETGNIVAFLGDIVAQSGDIIASVGVLQALNGTVVVGDLATPKYTELAKGILSFIGTPLTLSNPIGTDPTPNQLRALNTPKAWVSFTSNGVAGDSICVIHDSHSIASVVKTTTHFFVRVATPFDSSKFCVVSGIHEIDQQWIEVKAKTTTSCEVWLYDTLGPKSPATIVGTQSIDLVFFGRQTT